MGEVFKNEAVELRCGDWRTVLADVECDVLGTDPPYSQRTAAGYRTGNQPDDVRGILYGHTTEADALELAKSWAPRTASWAVIWCDHVAWPWHEAAWAAQGWATFAPVIWVKKAAPPRLSGDGPASQVDHIMVARPRKGYKPDGSRPGWYLAETPRYGHSHQGVVGNKDPLAVAALLADYTQPDDLICDPYSGSGTTLFAAQSTGRRGIGAEILPEHFAIAADRLRGLGPRETRTGQLNLLVPA